MLLLHNGLQAEVLAVITLLTKEDCLTSAEDYELFIIEITPRQVQYAQMVKEVKKRKINTDDANKRCL